MTGATPAAMVALLEGMGADAIGVNCSFGPKALAGVVAEYLKYASIPVLLKPNAGLPRAAEGKTFFDVWPEEFAADVTDLIQRGVRIAGGCCGTTPDHIHALTQLAADLAPIPLTAKSHTLVSSYTLFAMISWLRNPYKGNRAEVAVNQIRQSELCAALALTVLVTFGFYFILDHFETANMIPSTLSVATSFLAVYLTFRRSPYFALVYAANDIVLIVLWTLAAMENISYLSVIICFVMFFVNDLYGFVSWKRMEKRQKCAV